MSSRNYTLDDLKSDYIKSPKYVTFKEQQRLFKIGSESEREFEKTVVSKFLDRANFSSTTSSLFKPITDTQKETAKTIIKNQETVNDALQQKLEDQNKIVNKAIEYKQQTTQQTTQQTKQTKEEETKEETKDIIRKYLSNRSRRDLLFGIVEFKDDSIGFACLEILDKYDFLVSEHRFDFDDEDKKIFVTREDALERREYKLTENVLRYLTLDIVDIDDENAKKEYLNIITYAIGPELLKIKNARSENRKTILNIFRESTKFKELIAPLIGIKKLSYDDLNKPGDGLNYSRPIVISSNPNEQMKRLMVLLGTKKSLGEKDNYNIGLEEFTAILDELLKSNTISKLNYKTFLQKYNRN